jgi:hypothetical protein
MVPSKWKRGFPFILSLLWRNEFLKPMKKNKFIKEGSKTFSPERLIWGFILIQKIPTYLGDKPKKGLA